MSNWTFRFLNFPGRLVLVCSVLQAMPQYQYSAIAAPKSISNEIRSIQRDFLWRGKANNGKWALVSWDKLCLRDPDLLGKVLGAKTWWHWITNPTASWAKLWKAKYAPTHHLDSLIRLLGNVKGSPIWNQAWDNRNIIQDHCF